MIHAFTVAYSEIARQIRTWVRVCNGLTIAVDDWKAKEANAKEYTAIWDTGATSSAITQRVVNELELSVISRGITNTAAGAKETTMHDVHLWLPNNVVVNHCLASCVDLELLGVDILIGMDVITQGDFSISNYEGKTVMSFRCPSQECIDYVKKSTPRNALCPCGSGKKYKRCHGK
jgi:hypothetical protein